MNKYFICFLSVLFLCGAGVFADNDTDADVRAQEARDYKYDELPSNYQSLTAEKKQELLWTRISSGKWKSLPELKTGGWASILANLGALLTLGKSFSHDQDELPKGLLGYHRVKFIHTFGVTGKIEYVPTQEGQVYYTGVLKSGAIGVARLSLAGSPKSIGYTPGMATKLLRDGKISVNIFAMNSLSGQGSNQNWFARSFSNIIPPAEGFLLKQLEKIFATVHKPPSQLPLDHLGAYDNKGNWESDNRYPHQVFLRPGKDVKNLIGENSTEDFRTSLGKIKSGTTIYEVWGRSKQSWEQNPQDMTGAIQIGNIVLRSELVASHYGDKRLFFKHYGGK